MKSIRRLVHVCLCISLLLTFVQTVPTYAITEKNRDAHKALKQQLIEDYKTYSDEVNPTLRYVYLDLDGDKVDELITYPDFGCCTQLVYDYQNGKVVEVAGIGQGEFTSYYQKSKVLFVSGSGHMGHYFRSYYQFVGDTYKYKIVAYREEITEDDRGNLLMKPTYSYYVNDKKVSKAKYQKYVSTLKKGKARSLTNITWQEYPTK